MLSLLWARTLAAQGAPAPIRPDTIPITADAIAGYGQILASDSFWNPSFPSRGLEPTIRYVAAQFAAFGLTPRPPLFIEPGQSPPAPTLIERYSRYPWPDVDRARLVLTFGDQRVVAPLAANAYMASQTIPQQVSLTGTLLLAGQFTKDMLRTRLRSLDKKQVVVYVPPIDAAPSSQSSVLESLASGSWRTIVVSPADSVEFARRQAMARQHLPNLVSEDSAWIVYLRPERVAGLSALLTVSGIDIARLRTDSTPRVQEIPALQVALDLPAAAASATAGDSAANVIGVLEGSDSALRNQYIVFVAAMDRFTGLRQAGNPKPGGRVERSGLTVLLALAKAFSQSEHRPARSLVFLATSGSATGYQGSTAFVRDLLDRAFSLSIGGGKLSPAEAAAYHYRPTSVVLTVTLDLLGQPGDSVVLVGLNDVALAAPASWLLTAHPELGLTLVDGGTITTQGGADHFAFVHYNGTPSLLVHGGAVVAPADTGMMGPPLDADAVARRACWVFYLGQALSDALQKPEWTPEGRRRLSSNRMFEMDP